MFNVRPFHGYYVAKWWVLIELCSVCMEGLKFFGCVGHPLKSGSHEEIWRFKILNHSKSWTLSQWRHQKYKVYYTPRTVVARWIGMCSQIWCCREIARTWSCFLHQKRRCLVGNRGPRFMSDLRRSRIPVNIFGRYFRCTVMLLLMCTVL